MSINAISSVSLYEYYYQINKEDKKKKESPIEKEMREYGLTPTDNDALNVALLRRAKELKANEDLAKEEIPYSDRPWADLMYQLNIQFNPDPKDDIEDIKKELAILTKGMDDDELNKEISDLESYVENLYLNFQQNYSTTLTDAFTLTTQLNNLSVLNQASLL